MMKLRLGMIGDDPEGLSEAVHRIAARLDNEYQLMCATFANKPGASHRSGVFLDLPWFKCYGSCMEMTEKERRVPKTRRMQVVCIVTPGRSPFAAAKFALENGFHVIMDQITPCSLAEAMELRQLARHSGALLCLTQSCTGYPMIKEARQLIGRGELGEIRQVCVEFSLGNLTESIEPERPNQPSVWLGTGSQAFELAEYITGLKVSKTIADTGTLAGRAGAGIVLLKFDNGASGILLGNRFTTTQDNPIRIRLYGDRGCLEWQQGDANTLTLIQPDRPIQLLQAGNPYLSALTRRHIRTLPGQPEGYLEALANIYRSFALTIRAELNGEAPQTKWLDFPGIEEGIRSIAFLENISISGSSDQKWCDFILHK